MELAHSHSRCNFVACVELCRVVAERQCMRRKSLLRTLAEHTSSAGEKEALLHLCSREGKQSYAANVLTPALGLLEVGLLALE